MSKQECPMEPNCEHVGEWIDKFHKKNEQWKRQNLDIQRLVKVYGDLIKEHWSVLTSNERINTTFREYSEFEDYYINRLLPEKVRKDLEGR